MFPSVARGVLNLQILKISKCPSMEEVISEEEKGEELTKESLFPRLEELVLEELPKVGHFFLTNHTQEFPSLRKVDIFRCPEMKTIIQKRSVSTLCLIEDTEVKDDIHEVTQEQIFNSKVSCPSLVQLQLCWIESTTALCSHQLLPGYFSKLEQLRVSCHNWRSLMSPLVARVVVNLRLLTICDCSSMEVVITEEEQREKMTNEPLFPRLEKLELIDLPKLRHFFLTRRALEFPFLSEVQIESCPEMKKFVQLGFVSTPSLKRVIDIRGYRKVEVQADDLNKAIEQIFNAKVHKESDDVKSEASIGASDVAEYGSRW